MLALEQVSVINDLKGTKECRNKGKAVKKQSFSNKTESEFLKGCTEHVLQFCRNSGFLPGGGRNDDVEPLDFNQLKIGLS